MPKQLPSYHGMHTRQAAQTCHNRNRLSFGSGALIDPAQQLPSQRSVVYRQYEAAILRMHASMLSRTKGQLLSHHEKESTPRMPASHTAGVASATAHRQLHEWFTWRRSSKSRAANRFMADTFAWNRRIVPLPNVGIPRYLQLSSCTTVPPTACRMRSR